MGEKTGQAQSGGVNISGGTVDVGGDIIGGNKGLTAEEIVDVLMARGMLQTADTIGLQRRVIVELAQRIAPEVADFEQAVTELDRAVSIAVEVIERGERGGNDDDFVNAVLARVAAETKRGDLDAGAAAVDDGLGELEAKYRSQRITLLDEGIRVDTLRRDAPAVCRRIETLVVIDTPSERPAWLPEFRARYDSFYEDGEKGGINFSLSVAVELARRMVATARDSSERGKSKVLLGNALSALGERESSTARLEEAVTAYRAALEEYTRERAPLDWAAAQNHLGNALLVLGQRESGTERLEEAIVAFHAALEERTRASVPLDWAATQNNLGGALLTLGKRESGTQRLEEAVTALREALKERTRERVPVKWAATQANLGNALSALGERESGTQRLEEAVAAYRAALQEFTRARPLDWAKTQNNLGDTLRALGERESGTERLEEAVTALRAALTERTRARVPLDWAATQANLGNALSALGERESGTQRLEEAVAAYRAALQEFTRARVPLDWAGTQNNLGAALYRLGERESGTERLEEAVAAYRAALEERARERVPLDWARTQTGLGSALSTLGERTRDLVKLAEARKAIEAAFDVFMLAGQEQYRSYFENQLSELDRQIAELTPPR